MSVDSHSSGHVYCVELYQLVASYGYHKIIFDIQGDHDALEVLDFADKDSAVNCFTTYNVNLAKEFVWRAKMEWAYPRSYRDYGLRLVLNVYVLDGELGELTYADTCAVCELTADDFERDYFEFDGNWYDINDAASYMDDSLRERLHNELAPCSANDFAQAYADASPDGWDFVANLMPVCY